MACNPPSPVDQRDRGVIDQRDAIPQDIPLRCAKEQCALADRELWLRADPDEPRLVLAEPVVVRNPEPLQRCPRLPLGRDVLALVFADGALSRWSVTRRILCAAGTADECRHGLPRLNVPPEKDDEIASLHRFAVRCPQPQDIRICKLRQAADVSEWDGPAVLPPRTAQRMTGGLEARGAHRHVP